MKDRNAPAYPSHGSMGEVVWEGATIREAFVMAAMQGYIAADVSGNVPHEKLATLAIESADETLRQLGYNA